VYTADTNYGSYVQQENFAKNSVRENLNVLTFHDDSCYINFTINGLRKKGVKIVDFPQYYDLQSIVPFVLLNDHSILVVRNPKKDVLKLL
jgi:hypothetical protein